MNRSILQATKLVWSLLLPVLFPVSPWGGVSASQRPLLLAVPILFSGREVCPLSDLPFFSSLLSHPPMGCVMLVDGLQLYHTLTSTQEMRLICWEHDWKLPRRSLNAVGLWRVRWIKATQRGATVWTIGATFFSFLPTNHTLGKSNLSCNFSSIVFFKSPSSAFTTFVLLLRNQSWCGSMLVAAHEACAPVFLPGLIRNWSGRSDPVKVACDISTRLLQVWCVLVLMAALLVKAPSSHFLTRNSFLVTGTRAHAYGHWHVHKRASVGTAAKVRPTYPHAPPLPSRAVGWSAPGFRSRPYYHCVYFVIFSMHRGEMRNHLRPAFTGDEVIVNTVANVTLNYMCGRKVCISKSLCLQMELCINVFSFVTQFFPPIHAVIT